MFFKQLVRCPYLFESEELALFIRPHMNVERALTFLPKLNAVKLLEKVTPYYSIMGEIESNQLSPLSMQINSFCGQCKRNLSMLEKFKDQIDKLEMEFNNEWGCDTKLNSFFFSYE